MVKNFKFSFQYLILSISVGIISCQTTPDRSFLRIPEELSKTEDLLRAIKPNKNYEYWACFRKDFPGKINIKTEIIISKGDVKKLINIKFNEPTSGFKTKIWAGYYFIRYLENDSIKLVTNEKQLIKFIGNVNSIEEALLIADIKDLHVDYSRLIGSSYKKTKNGYDFYLAKFHKCFVKTEPFKVSIDSLGNYNAKSLGFYYNIDNGLCED